ncbi:MAG TPA: alanine racemase [Alphaproteobacteria bacterium]|nr:alanine racemase [Alphaproteobacteria bacterium]
MITIDLERIERNAHAVVSKCRGAGIGVFGVTKGTCGMPQVARAMLRGGVIGIGESRFENIRRLRASGIDCPILLLRSPPLSRIEEVITSVDISLNSELAIIEELSRIAGRMSKIHDIILMVDLGDLREGIWPDDLMPTVEKVLSLPNVRIVGLGTNLTCFGAVLPTEENMGALIGHAREIEGNFDLALRYVSGGNSSSLPLLLSGRMPAGINNLRIGEAILQGGRDTFLDRPWAELDRDAFRLTGELLEVKTKPSVPIGPTGLDAFGRKPVFEDKGERLRGILNLGREDAVVEGLTPVEPGISVLGASSDHLVIDLTEADPRPQVGSLVSFHMNYGALLAAMTSEYVEKEPIRGAAAMDKSAGVRVLMDAGLEPVVKGCKLEPRLAALKRDVRTLAVPPVEAPLEAEQPAWQSAVAGVLALHAVPLLIGLDHSISLAGLRALAGSADAFGLLWFDAVAGFQPSLAGTSPAPGASVLYQALGYDSSVRSVQPELSPENVVLIGLRDVEPKEAEIIRNSRVTVFTIADIDALGIREVMRQALRTALAGTEGLYVSYCPAVTDIPATITGSGGITLRETHQAMETIAQTNRLLAMDVVGLAPGGEPRIAAESAHFVLSCFGKAIL